MPGASGYRDLRSTSGSTRMRASAGPRTPSRSTSIASSGSRSSTPWCWFRRSRSPNPSEGDHL